MIPNYAMVGVLLIAAIVFAGMPLILVHLIAPKKRSQPKSTTYECGVLTTGETWVKFRIQYYIYALFFLIFDLESVFLFPWAVSFTGLADAGFALVVLAEMAIFILLLAIALVFSWASGDLQWV